ncbi:MAG: hypothetical protein P4L55_04295 [Syntrophobacteraceae bacterium]|nr:hypothetical protein [Syntrophobacteraceae bacterium]
MFENSIIEQIIDCWEADQKLSRGVPFPVTKIHSGMCPHPYRLISQ